MRFFPVAIALSGCLIIAGCTQPVQNPVPVAGLPAPPVDRTSESYFRGGIGETVLFVVDEATLTPDARVILEEQARWMLANTAYTAVIEGHADEQGTREYNLALGARRAASVQEYLVARGVASNRLRTVSYGKERPLEICSEEACYQRNRRAVTVISSGATS